MIDTAQIKTRAGKGGNGIASFRREKYMPKGGPWGGDGGDGGAIIFEVDPHQNTLNTFRRQKKYHAQNGKPGMKNDKKGHDGEDLVIKVPPGTLIKNDADQVVFDMVEAGHRETLSKGGRGGLGNTHFKSSINRTPMQFTEGEEIPEQIIHLELKLLADVGIIGLPSSGKTTLLNSLTRTRAKTAEYHFTTLEPNLGVLHVNQYMPKVDIDIVLADIPGLIEGASEGKGLGHDFLRHIERTQVLVHLVDGNDTIPNLISNYKTIQAELKDWNPILLDKPQIFAVNKIDITDVSDIKDEIKKAFAKENLTPLYISAAGHLGLKELVEQIFKTFTKAKADKKESDSFVSIEDTRRRLLPRTFNIVTLPNRRIVFRDNKSHSYNKKGD